MNKDQNNSFCAILKKTFAATAVLLIILNPFFAGKNNLKFFFAGFKDVAVKQQSASNLSMHINGTVKSVSRLFTLEYFTALARSAVNSSESASSENGLPLLSDVLPVFAVAEASNVSQFLNADDPVQTKNTGYRVADFEVRSASAARETRRPSASYFIIMLIFFASSRKIFTVLFRYKNILIPAYF